MAKKTNYRNDLVLQMYQEGKPVTVIMKATDMSHDAIAGLLKREGVYKNTLDTAAQNKKELISLIDNAADAKPIKKAFVARGQPARVFTAYNKTFVSFGEMKEYKRQMSIRVKLLSADGSKPDQITAITGLNKKSIAKILR